MADLAPRCLTCGGRLINIAGLLVHATLPPADHLAVPSEPAAADELQRLRDRWESAQRHANELIDRAERAEAVIERIRELHESEQHPDEAWPWCVECSTRNEGGVSVPWPCPTLLAIDDPERLAVILAGPYGEPPQQPTPAAKG